MENLTARFDSLVAEANAISLTRAADSPGQEECAALRDRAMDHSQLGVGSDKDMEQLSRALVGIRMQYHPEGLVGVAGARALKDEHFAAQVGRQLNRQRPEMPAPATPNAPAAPKLVRPVGRENSSAFDRDLREAFRQAPADTSPFGRAVAEIRRQAAPQAEQDRHNLRESRRFL